MTTTISEVHDQNVITAVCGQFCFLVFSPVGCPVCLHIKAAVESTPVSQTNYQVPFPALPKE